MGPPGTKVLFWLTGVGVLAAKVLSMTKDQTCQWVFSLCRQAKHEFVKDQGSVTRHELAASIFGVWQSVAASCAVVSRIDLHNPKNKQKTI